jgi:hypothetical protein
VTCSNLGGSRSWMCPALKLFTVADAVRRLGWWHIPISRGITLLLLYSC